jgi:hypothetical protein
MVAGETAEDGRTRAERVARKLLDLAERGDVQAIKTVLERLDGRALMTVNVSAARLSVADGFDGVTTETFDQVAADLRALRLRIVASLNNAGH